MTTPTELSRWRLIQELLEMELEIGGTFENPESVVDVIRQLEVRLNVTNRGETKYDLS